MTYKTRYDWLQAGRRKQEFLLPLPEGETGFAVRRSYYPVDTCDHVVNPTIHLHLKSHKGKHEHLSTQQLLPRCVVPPTLTSCDMYCAFLSVYTLWLLFLKFSIGADGTKICSASREGRGGRLVLTPHHQCSFFHWSSRRTKKKLISVTWVLERTIPTERPPLVGKASANFLRIEGATWSAWRIPTAVFSYF
jgi:hypothetical protein